MRGLDFGGTQVARRFRSQLTCDGSGSCHELRRAVSRSDAPDNPLKGWEQGRGTREAP